MLLVRWVDVGAGAKVRVGGVREPSGHTACSINDIVPLCRAAWGTTNYTPSYDVPEICVHGVRVPSIIVNLKRGEGGKRMLLQDSPLRPERKIVKKAYRLHL